MFNISSSNPFNDSQECLLIGLKDTPEKFSGILTELDAKFENGLTELVKSGDLSAKLKEISKVHTLGKIASKRLVFIGLGKEKDLKFDEIKEAFGKAFKFVNKNRLQSAAVALDTFVTESLSHDDVANALSEAFALATYEFAGYKQKSNEPEKKIEQLSIFTEADKDEIEAALTVGYAFGKATNSARTLVNLPGNMLTATELAHYAEEVAKKYGKMLSVSSAKELPLILGDIH
ncbi:hypothetical protein HV454_08215 [Bacillus sporothermodurans]|uniref:M17 family peptidase N-terminal domain-containing protein n=1 Tax=Heyndrickxia sporothermodurans TaxID=46224 RepID=UPI001D8E19A2|nr:hypothetical protein [Heyndrickxia sporothermodurans]MBL5770983.1 hypothetical protein [Heyndrickxia sporothermodurans]MBL5774653.1 hypothetical protein [Heyndrickxia sporothermodurans]MBL5777743.1 hypothetical protein [Heyndrickxia sporothermodurans]MBL5781844.1 hypothetical protein [Heyndrickxia sporothermodurans]